ncbi:synaptic vesicular amine transporter isoform X2 [Phymastichus coffea]|uniref:synaptic vesicular amine transporter isoform X2 n=1 Tax=Phymastichus coffea TaxID=108790 RepID=UPI00273C7B0F|nr:synaptic vesicular amine transporter isoform X2 [Phymastichus coffea]
MYELMENSRFLLVTTVYFSLLLDNILLTVVVPIIPDYLYTLEGNSSLNGEEDENGRVGLLLSSKAFVQLFLNPAVGILTGTFGYAKPLLLGNLSLLLAALLFAVGTTYETLFLARSIQGVSSACIGVSGMSLVAFQYPEEDKRSKVMGFVLGSIALGVLAGYPIGSVLYDLEGKMAPFLLVAALIVLLIGLQLFALDFDPVTQKGEGEQSSWMYLLLDTRILIIAGAIWFSTTPMAILEPCLPIWLRTHIKAKKWQLGAAFIPDSVGYLVGTNFFGMIAYYYGRYKTAVLAMLPWIGYRRGGCGARAAARFAGRSNWRLRTSLLHPADCRQSGLFSRSDSERRAGAERRFPMGNARCWSGERSLLPTADLSGPEATHGANPGELFGPRVRFLREAAPVSALL